MNEMKSATLNSIMGEVAINFDVFEAFMEAGIKGKMDGSIAITEHHSRSNLDLKSSQQ